MTIKAATTLAIVGASIQVAVGLWNTIVRFMYFPHGDFPLLNILYICSSTTFLVFFITLRINQK